jgi:hypothetical protein
MMTELSALWLPILLSAVIVFVASSIIHMLLPWHKGDYPKLPNEDKVLEALRPFAILPGDYMAPRPSSRQEMRSPNALTRICRKKEEGSGDRAHGSAKRPHGDGPEPDPLVPVLRRCQPVRFVRRRKRAASRRITPWGLPFRRIDGIHRLFVRALADVDLVSPRLELNHQGDRGRAHLRAPHGIHVCMAVAAVGFAARLSSWRRQFACRVDNRVDVA